VILLRKSDEIYNNKSISSTVKLGGRAVIVWGAFLDAGISEQLHCVNLFKAPVGNF